MPKDPSAQTTIRSVPLDILRDQQCTQLSIYIYIVFTSSEPVNNVQIVYYIHIRKSNIRFMLIIYLVYLILVIYMQVYMLRK